MVCGPAAAAFHPGPSRMPRAASIGYAGFSEDTSACAMVSIPSQSGSGGDDAIGSADITRFLIFWMLDLSRARSVSAVVEGPASDRSRRACNAVHPKAET